MKISKFFRKKRNIWIIVILIAVVAIAGFFILRKKNNNGSVQTGLVARQNLEETVLATGQVVSATDLDLSFQSSGIARRVTVKEGDKAVQGQVLASLDQSNALAALTSAQGTLAQAQASYDKLINGASASDIRALQDAVNVAETNLNNTYNSSLNTLNAGYTAIYNAYTAVNSVANNYFTISDQESIKVQSGRTNINSKMADAMSNINNAVANGDGDIDKAVSSLFNDLNSVFLSLQIIRDQCDQGIYYSKVSSADKTSLDTQKTAVSTAITNINTLQNSIASYGAALQVAENALSAKQARPRQEDVDLAKAQILSAQGQVDAAQNALNNLTIIAPASGTITQVNIKVGEQAMPSVVAISLQDVNNLHVEADVSEANVASLQLGQPIDYTFDALGPNQHFQGKILTINPASTIISGVVNYKITGSLDNVPDIKPGMTANMTILVAQKDNVLAVPSTAIVNKNNSQYVKVVDDAKKLTYHEVSVQTGLEADGGLVEILSGLNDGQQIVTYIKP